MDGYFISKIIKTNINPYYSGVIFHSPSVKHDQSFGSFFVHDSVTTFSASYWISGFYFVLSVAFTTNINHRYFSNRLLFIIGVSHYEVN